MKKTVLKNFTIFVGKLQAGNFLKKKLQQWCFPLNKILKNVNKPFISHESFFSLKDYKLPNLD